MFTAQKSERAGFSLVELLTALAVAALILPAIVAVLPRAFDALVTASTTARAARATAAFDAAFDRDFASLVSAFGFTGEQHGTRGYFSWHISCSAVKPNAIASSE